MSEKRFFVKVYSNNEPFFFDEKQEYVEKRYTCEDVRNLHPMEYWQVVELLNEQQTTIEQLEKDKAFAEDYANIFEKENVKLRKKLNNYKATVLGFVWIMEQNGRISGKDDDFVKDLFKLINDE